MDDDKIYISNLPVLPNVVTELLTKMGNADVEVEDVVKIIEKDASLSLKILRLANSAFYGLPKHVATVKNAVVILGFNGIRSVVLSINISKLLNVTLKYTDDKNNFWNHSLLRAIIAKKIAKENISKSFVDPEEAFCGGLLFGIGKFYLSLQYEDQYEEIVEEIKDQEIDFFSLEDEIFGITHNYVGSIISKVWKFPESLRKIFSENSNKEEDYNLALIVRAAEIFAHHVGVHDFVDEVSPAKDSVLNEKLYLAKDYLDSEEEKEMLLEELSVLIGVL